MSTAIAPTPRARFGARDVVPGSPELAELRASDPAEGPAALRARLAEDGYLLIRGLHDRDLVLAARRQMLAEVAAAGRLAPDAPLLEGRIRAGAGGAFHGGDRRLVGAPAFQALVRAPRLVRFFSALFAEPATTYDYQWLRLVGTGEATGAHVDAVYMGRGTPDVITCWTPIGDVGLDQGPLAICVGSHRSPGFEPVRRTYGRMDVDRDRVAGWFSSDPWELAERFGARWATTAFRAGDALLFGMQTMHASLENVSDRYRLTADTRWQAAAQPADERWVGERPRGHTTWHSGPQKPMAQQRREWGV